MQSAAVRVQNHMTLDARHSCTMLLHGTPPAGRIDELGPLARHVLQCTGKGETGMQWTKYQHNLKYYTASSMQSISNCVVLHSSRIMVY